MTKGCLDFSELLRHGFVTSLDQSTLEIFRRQFFGHPITLVVFGLFVGQFRKVFGRGFIIPIRVKHLMTETKADMSVAL